MDSLYKTFQPNFTTKYKDSLKYSLIEKIERSQDSIYHKLPNLPRFPLNKNNLPNNAYFASFKTYNSKQNEFENMFKIQVHNDVEVFLKYLKGKYNQ